MASLRITAGTLRGRRVAVPPHDVRPTSERARQAYFNIVSERIAGARFLDLFAGSGVFALEATSRGAAAATAVERGRRAAAAIANLAKAWSQPIDVVNDDVIAAIPRLGGEAFDLVYADPPYGYEQYDELLLALEERLKLRNDALVAIEHRRRTEPFTATAELRRLTQTRRAEYGDVAMTFFTKGTNG